MASLVNCPREQAHGQFLLIFAVNCPREPITYCGNQRNARLEKSGLLEETRAGQLGETRPGQLDETRAGLGMTEISSNLVPAGMQFHN